MTKEPVELRLTKAARCSTLRPAEGKTWAMVTSEADPDITFSSTSFALRTAARRWPTRAK
jgi:hypothetical protein